MSEQNIKWYRVADIDELADKRVKTVVAGVPAREI